MVDESSCDTAYGVQIGDKAEFSFAQAKSVALLDTRLGRGGSGDQCI